MSESAAGKFSELWKGVSKLCDGKTFNRVTGPQMATKETSVSKGFHSPQGRHGSARLGLVHGESPGDVEPSQDIVWDCTSPKAGPRYNKVVEISEIVNRIAPKEGQQQQSGDAHLLKWIGENLVSSTPDVPKPRARRKSCRQSSVEDLLKLARQFDENMQHDVETEQHHTLGETPSSAKAEGSKGPTCSDGVEAELHALFDCSTQKFSGALSQGFSQEARVKMMAAAQTESKLSERSGAALQAAVDGGSVGRVTPQFDDDWEDDDLLNDPDVIAMTQNPLLVVKTPSNTKTKTTLSSSSSSVVQTSTSRLRPSTSGSRPGGIQQLCPRLKTTSRSTFRLGPSADHQATCCSNTTFTTIQSQAAMPELESSTKKPAAAAAAPVTTTAGHTTAPDLGMWDSHWDCGEDDQLLYQACDTLERSSGVQAEGGRSSSTSGKTPPIEASTANKQSACSRLVRSNSLPETRGWSMLRVGGVSGAGAAPMSQSLPQGRGSITAGSTASSNPRPACKRSWSHLAETSNKVFVSGQLQAQAKCSAAEIEKKKQEALARRRLRMQNN